MFLLIENVIEATLLAGCELPPDLKLLVCVSLERFVDEFLREARRAEPWVRTLFWFLVCHASH